MRFALVMLALGVLAGPVAAQYIPVPPAPPPAEVRTYRWSETFPVTPPFAQWIQVLDTSTTENRLWLHEDSVSWRSDRWLQVDLLSYSAAMEGGPRRYFRSQFALSCDGHALTQIVANAEVVIDPEGLIRPVSPVTEITGVGSGGNLAGSVYQGLCFDDAERARFMAG